MIPRAPLRFVVVVLLCSVAAGARADIRVWSEETVDGDAGLGPEEEPLHLDVTGFLQPGYVWIQEPDTEPGLSGVPPSRDRFLLHRARLGVRALVYPWLRLRLELEAADRVEAGPVGPTDAWIDLRMVEGLHLRVGQMQVPFLRAWQFDDARQGFIDQPLYAGAAPAAVIFPQWRERRIGLAFHGLVGDLEAGPALEYGAGAFASPVLFSENETLVLAARLEGHLFGVPENPEAENDVARSFRPRLSVGLGGETGCDESRRWSRALAVDAELRLLGLYASAGFVWSKHGTRHGDFLAGPLDYGDPEACGPSETRLPAVVPTRVAWGTHVQAQYALPALLFPVDGQALELLARFDLARPSAPDDGFFGGDESSSGYVPPFAYGSSLEAPDQWRLTLGVSWYPTASNTLRLSANYQLRRETEDVSLLSPGVPDTVVVDELENDVLWVELTAGL